MPIYEYECSLCRFRFERRQGFDEAAMSDCPQCGGKAYRLLHPVPIIYKGSGFYTTDYGSGSSNPGKKGEAKEEG